MEDEQDPKPKLKMRSPQFLWSTNTYIVFYSPSHNLFHLKHFPTNNTVLRFKITELCYDFYYKKKTKKVYPRMKISVITDISVLRLYEYIGYIGDMSADILKKNIGKLKIIKNSWKYKENLIII